MRRIDITDVTALARHLATLPASERMGAALNVLLDCEEADRYRLSCGNAHPEFGTGSIMARVGRLPRIAEIALDDLDHLDAMDRAIGAIRAHVRQTKKDAA